MRYNQLGSTGTLVSEICLGTMTFGGRGFWTAIGTLDQSVADGIVVRALDAGVNFIDTADVYSEGLSEAITGRAIVNSGRKRTDVGLATKGFGVVGTGPNDRGASRGHILDAAKASLKRLGTDYIDLYQIHGFDPIGVSVARIAIAWLLHRMMQRQTADQQRSQVGGVPHHSSADSDRVETGSR
jgi:aryl-alcohol dehydrogenase-like predicted oxidoreductase